MTADHEYPTGLRLAIILLSLFLGTFLVAVDTTIVSVAIPKISTQFHALNHIGWYGSAYLVTITAFQPAGGTIYKIFNAKIIYLSAIVIFEGAVVTPLNDIYAKLLLAGSALCAAAPSSPVFILGRAVAGSDAALLIQGAISVITHISTLEKRPLYIGLVVSSFGISASFSPVLGGALTTRVSWRWCFWM
jgi:MFS family permease